eukprot:scaffold4487_cov273-Chaetoceros_neogracile.AAC.45
MDCKRPMVVAMLPKGAKRMQSKPITIYPSLSLLFDKDRTTRNYTTVEGMPSLITEDRIKELEDIGLEWSVNDDVCDR